MLERRVDAAVTLHLIFDIESQVHGSAAQTASRKEDGLSRRRYAWMHASVGIETVDFV